MNLIAGSYFRVYTILISWIFDLESYFSDSRTKVGIIPMFDDKLVQDQHIDYISSKIMSYRHPQAYKALHTKGLLYHKMIVLYGTTW